MIITINDDLTSYITDEDKTLECSLPSYNPETLVAFANKEEVQAFAETSLSNPNYWSPKLSDEEKAANLAAAMALENVSRAKQELQTSDWSDLPSVRDTANTPHLVNGQDFDSYRAQLRAIVVNKPTVIEIWPECPQAQWSAL